MPNNEAGHLGPVSGDPIQIEFTGEQLDLVTSAIVCRIAQALEGPQDDPLVISLLQRLRAEYERLMKIKETK